MKTVLITGACINTGVAIVEKFASEGYNVIFTGRSMEKVHAAEKAYRERFPEVKYLDREEDMGLEGLRRAKKSYHPHHMVEKCWAHLREAGYEY